MHREALRGIELQRSSIDALRTRAGTLLAAASVVTTFLGGQALEDGRDPATWGVVAIAAFIALAVLTLVVLLPWRFHLFLEPAWLVEEFVDKDPQPSKKSMLRDLALYLDDFCDRNKKKLRVLQWSFRCAAILVGVEVAAWLLEISERTG